MDGESPPPLTTWNLCLSGQSWSAFSVASYLISDMGSLHSRFVAQARGECQYFSNDTITTAGEGCKSNALMRCCKDIGIASELWDPRFIRTFKKAHCAEVWVENVSTKKKRQIWMRKDNQTPSYPFQLAKN